MNAVVMDRAEVGAQTIVAACAFVPAGTRLPAKSLVVGTPAKVLRALTDDEVERKAEGTATYQQLARRSQASLREVAPLAEAEADRARLVLPDLRPLGRG
jgi:phenylacetic acid degradation protein